MTNCCTKMQDGSTCPTPASRKVTLQAGGLVFRVPICERCFKAMRAAPKASEDPLRDLLGLGKK